MEPDLTDCRVIDGKTYCEIPGAEAPAGAGAAGAAGDPAVPAADDPVQILIGDLSRWAEPFLTDPMRWVQRYLLDVDFIAPLAIQLLAVFGALAVGSLAARPLKRLANRGVAALPPAISERIDETTPRLVQPLCWSVLLFTAQTVLAATGQPFILVRVAVTLSLVWLFIRLVTGLVPEEFRKLATYVIAFFAILNVTGLLPGFLDWTQSVGPRFGDRVISPAFVVRAVVMGVLFALAASWINKRLKQRVQTLPQVDESLRTLLSNALQIAVFVAAILLLMAGLGIPTSGLAVLVGAFSLGLAFGLQQIIANFISGVILLTDRSIKPNDVIEVDDTYGIVKSLGLRYASVITLDGKEHLIPNEQLITDKVVNWSFSNRHVRVKKSLRVEYESDIDLALRLMQEGAATTPRVLPAPPPRANIVAFGEEAVELQINFWISDPERGDTNVGSDVLQSIWGLFKDHGIDIPLRREEVLIEPGSTLKVEMVRAAGNAAGGGTQEPSGPEKAGAETEAVASAATAPAPPPPR